MTDWAQAKRAGLCSAGIRLVTEQSGLARCYGRSRAGVSSGSEDRRVGPGQGERDAASGGGVGAMEGFVVQVAFDGDDRGGATGGLGFRRVLAVGVLAVVGSRPCGERAGEGAVRRDRASDDHDTVARGEDEMVWGG